MIFRVLTCTFASLICLVHPTAQAQGLRPLQSQVLGAPTPDATQLAAQKSGDYIVAVVNSEPITNGDVRREAQRVLQQLAQQRRPLPDSRELAQAVLQRLISDKAQLQLARETGILIDDVAVDQAEETVARQNRVNLAELRRRVVADGIGLAQYREQLRNQLTLLRLRERDIDSRVRVSDLEVDQYLRDQPASADPANRELNLAQILIAAPESATPEQLAALEAKAQTALARARAGEDFGALAKELSDSPDKANGGQFGVRTADRYPPLFLDATAKLAEGGISGVIRSGAGFHVLKVVEKRAAGMTVSQSHARHILLRATPQQSEAQARDKLNDFKRRIQAGQADFATLARENSQDGSAAQGGDLGWASPGQFVPEFEDVMNALAPGQVSDALVSRFGVHLIQLIERRTVPLSQRDQREFTRNTLREKKLDEAFLIWAQEVRGRAYVEMREPPQLN